MNCLLPRDLRSNKIALLHGSVFAYQKNLEKLWVTKINVEHSLYNFFSNLLSLHKLRSCASFPSNYSFCLLPKSTFGAFRIVKPKTGDVMQETRTCFCSLLAHKPTLWKLYIFQTRHTTGTILSTPNFRFLSLVIHTSPHILRFLSIQLGMLYSFIGITYHCPWFVVDAWYFVDQLLSSNTKTLFPINNCSFRFMVIKKNKIEVKFYLKVHDCLAVVMFQSLYGDCLVCTEKLLKRECRIRNRKWEKWKTKKDFTQNS